MSEYVNYDGLKRYDELIKNVISVKTQIGSCSTAAGTAAKVVSVESGFKLLKGVRIGVKFTNSNTASNVTLNVNNTGAKSIYYNNAVYTETSNMICGYANRYVFYVYDGTNWVWDGYSNHDNTNTWKAANASQEGYVPKSTANKILRSDANGALYWGNDNNTTYSSKAAEANGTDVSLVTTGEKAIWNAKTSNTGTITGIKMNGVSKGTSGVVDLGTVITAHQDISGKLNKSGDTMTGALNTANNTWNKIGDDAAFGDHNVGGKICIKGLNNTPGIAFYNSSDALVGTIDVNNEFNFNKTIKQGGTAVSLSGHTHSYNDLTDKPTIPAAAANGTYTVKTLVGSTTTNVSDFTANQSSADDVTFVQGSNVTITPDATNRKITIAATDTKYTAGTDRLYFIGNNPTGGSANDTMTFWKGKGNGIAYFSTTGQLNNQPQQYGFMINLVSGGEVQQLWFGQTAGISYKRGGNGSTTSMGAWTACDTTYSSKAAASGGTDVSLVTTGEKYVWNSKTSNTGTVTKITAGTGLTGGDITTTGTIALATSGVTAGTYKRVTVDAYGRVTSGDNTDSDTKNTAGTTNKTGTKMFLAAATEQNTNPVTYSNSNCYIGTDNCLYSGGNKVLTSETYTGTVTGVKVGTTSYNPSSGIVTIPAYPTTLPASDVSAWAKASTKPSYSYSEINYNPTEITSAGGAVSINGTNPLQVITISAAVSGITFSAVPANGHSCHLIITAASDLSVAIAHGATMFTGYTSVCPGAADVSLDITAGGYVELDLLRVGTKIYVRGV